MLMLLLLLLLIGLLEQAEVLGRSDLQILLEKGLQMGGVLGGSWNTQDNDGLLISPVATGTTKSPTKAPALTETFGNLPADDLEFIKELDKQFKLHGNKIKIKVERDNSTSSGGKNSKRTIEGDLG